MPTYNISPQAGGGGANVTCDGYVDTGAASASWDTLRWNTGQNRDVTSTTLTLMLFRYGDPTSNFSVLSRSAYTFDISSITGTIISAKFRVYGTSKADNNNVAPTVNIYGVALTNANNIVGADYRNTLKNANTAYCDTEIAYADWTVGAYNEFVLNATGLANLVSTKAGTGIFQIASRCANYDVTGTVPPDQGSSYGYEHVEGYSADNASNKPILQIETRQVGPMPTFHRIP